MDMIYFSIYSDQHPFTGGNTAAAPTLLSSGKRERLRVEPDRNRDAELPVRCSSASSSNLLREQSFFFLLVGAEVFEEKVTDSLVFVLFQDVFF